MTSPQDSRELFERELKDELYDLTDNTSTFDETVAKVMSAHDLATTSLITRAMQQIEAGRCSEIGNPKDITDALNDLREAPKSI